MVLDPLLSNREIIIFTIKKLKEERFYYNPELELWSNLPKVRIEEIRKIILKNNYANPRPHNIVEIQITPRGEIIEENEIDRYGNDKAKSKKDWAKFLGLIFTAIFGTSTVIFAFLTYKLNSDKFTTDDELKELQLKFQNIELQLKKEKELHKSFVDSIHSTPIVKDSL